MTPRNIDLQPRPAVPPTSAISRSAEVIAAMRLFESARRQVRSLSQLGPIARDIRAMQRSPRTPRSDPDEVCLSKIKH